MNNFCQRTCLSGVFIALILAGLPLVCTSPAFADFWKRCEHCLHQVPRDSGVGDTCPHCGVRWGAMRQSFESAPRTWSGFEPAATGSRDRISRGRPRLTDGEKIEIQRQYQERRLAERAEARRRRFEQMTPEELAALYNPISDDARAARLFRQGEEAHARGNDESAAVWYGLAVRTAPNSLGAVDARRALARLTGLSNSPRSYVASR